MGSGSCRGASTSGQEPAQAYGGSASSSSTAAAQGSQAHVSKEFPPAEETRGGRGASTIGGVAARDGTGDPFGSTAATAMPHDQETIPFHDQAARARYVAVTRVQAAGARNGGGVPGRHPPAAQTTCSRGFVPAVAQESPGVATRVAQKTGDPKGTEQKTVVREVSGPGKGKIRPCRLFSIRSEAAMTQLEEIEAKLVFIENRVAEIDQLVRDGLDPAGVGKLKTELAMLEAEANKLESKGVDNVYTSELNSGKASAKETKKEQLKRLEALFALIEDVFHGIPAAGLPALPDAPSNAS